MTKATRVNDEELDLAINKLRIELFNLLKNALQDCLCLQSDDERLLTYSRIYFFTLHGIVGTYVSSEEPAEALLDRLSQIKKLLDGTVAEFRIIPRLNEICYPTNCDQTNFFWHEAPAISGT